MSEYGKEVAKKMEDYMGDLDSVSEEIHDIQHADVGVKVRGALAAGVAKSFNKSKESESKADEAHDVMEAIIEEGFDNAALESNFEQKLDDKITNLQPEWTQFQKDTDRQLAEKAKKSDLEYEIHQRENETGDLLNAKIDDAYFNVATGKVELKANGSIIKTLDITEASNTQEVQSYIDSLVSNGQISGITLSDDSVDNLKLNTSLRNYIFSLDEDNIFPLYINEWEIGAIDSSTGEDSSSNRRIRSISFIEVDGWHDYEIMNIGPLQIRIFEYDVDKEFIQHKSYINTSQPNYSFRSATRYVRFVMMHDGDNSITLPDDLSGLHVKMKKKPFQQKTIRDINYVLGITLSGATGAEASSARNVTSDFILAYPGQKLNINCEEVEFRLIEYDKNKGFDNRVVEYVDKITLEINKTSYYRITFRKSDNSIISNINEILDNVDVDLYYDRFTITPSAEPVKIRYMSHNIGKFNYGEGDNGIPVGDVESGIEEWKNLISTQNADVIGVQEYRRYVDQANEHDTYATLYENSYKFDRRHNKKDWFYFASKYSLSKITDVSLPSGEWSSRFLVRTSVNVGGKEIAIFMSHLVPGSTEGDRQLRQQQHDIILTELANEERFIFSGDFNNKDTEPFDYLNQYLNEGYKSANGSWHGRFNTAHSNNDLPIDNILTSANINIDTVTLGEKATSDHAPLIVDLTVY